jgi:leucyl-tRNA synthetase
MITVNELTAAKCSKREVLEPLVVLVAPFAPHIAEELWHRMGHDGTVCDAQWPVCDESLLVEDTFTYPVSFNGKMRFTIELPANVSQDEAFAAVKAHEVGQKWLDGKEPKKVIFVPKKIINIVI